MKVEIRNWMNSKIITWQEVDCPPDTSHSRALGLAAEKAVRAGVSLHCANLHEADMRGLKMTGAILSCSDMTGADLRDSDLRDADFGNAIIDGADLRGANLTNVDVFGTDMECAKLDDNIVIIDEPGKYRIK